MEADLPNLEPAAIGDIDESLPPAVAAENAHTAQSSSIDWQSVAVLFPSGHVNRRGRFHLKLKCLVHSTNFPVH